MRRTSTAPAALAVTVPGGPAFAIDHVQCVGGENFNGDPVKIERWHDISFPNRPPKVVAIQIL
ncbi:beta/gamma crystallin domain-containing protein [Nonomuraea sp. NPDC052265]|uniref:beta/gamma crystallin domain-containing protein n=1 Tax=Nonomuraea sp. NPDC052265 TaxID=3364374 RepID=UPI0037CB6B6A